MTSAGTQLGFDVAMMIGFGFHNGSLHCDGAPANWGIGLAQPFGSPDFYSQVQSAFMIFGGNA